MAKIADRKVLRQARELVRGSRKWLRINRDLLSSAQLLDISTAINNLAAAVAAAVPTEARSRANELENKINRALPPRRHAALRENIEVFLVAAIVAMAVRTFFLQPFKIPTGSMQPTLYGIHEERADPHPNVVRKLVDLVVFGMTHGNGMGTIRGDHIFVDKVSYHFRKPTRGEVVVFETRNIPLMGPNARGQFYIKRLVGLENDVLQIDPPHLRVNGEILDSRPTFERIYSLQNGYNGYVNHPPFGAPPRYLYSPKERYQVPPSHFFVLGDNTVSSSDGRYWGSVPEQNLVGRAILVYWPFSKRIGRID